MQRREDILMMREATGSYPPQRRRTPSFSSTLLDAIYRSTDDESKFEEVQIQQPSYSRQYYNNNEKQRGKKERMNLRQAVMIEDWMEKKQTSSHQFLHHSSTTSSSSESSSGGIFSSSETDTRKKKTTTKTKQQQQKHPQREGGGGGFARTKLKALKIYYGELNQKVRQPISPGSRIATFLSSIFSSENVKKAKMCYVGAVEDVSFDNHNHKSKSPCFSSSASSFSRRSCMSTKTPSSARDGVKRSVRFYPISVILGEDSDTQQQYIYHNEPSLLPLSSSVRKITRNNSSIKEVKKNTKENGAGGNGKVEFGFKRFYDNGEDEDEDDDDDDDDDDDAMSCSSSDLFELDHLIGTERYQQELPVYETTNLETNKAIANGLRL